MPELNIQVKTSHSCWIMHSRESVLDFSKLYIVFDIGDNIMFSTELITWPCTFPGVHWLGYLTFTMVKFWDFRGIRS